MSYLRTFAPWIVFALVPSGDWQWGAALAFVVAAAVITWQRRAGQSPDSMIIEAGSVVFFAVIAAIAFADPSTGLHPYTAALSSLVLAVIAWASLGIGRPFTLGIARLSTPREFWDQPLFRRTNVIITAVWAAAFTVSGATLIPLAGDGAASAIVQVAGFVVPMAFTVRYAAAVRARAATARAAA